MPPTVMYTRIRTLTSQLHRCPTSAYFVVLESRGISPFSAVQVLKYLARVPQKLQSLWRLATREGQMTSRLRLHLPCAHVCVAHARATPAGLLVIWTAVAMGLSRVRAVFFDLDNTLIDTAGASRRGMLEVMSPRPWSSSGWGQHA
jgi:hypothetical protein